MVMDAMRVAAAGWTAFPEYSVSDMRVLSTRLLRTCCAMAPTVAR
jgi:hypothetical protein